MANLDGDGLNRFEWQGTLREALLELDAEKLRQKVTEAETAIFERLQELSLSQDSSDERRALVDATNTLRVLKKESLKYPDWKSD
jgi:hypothetical protein